MSDYLDGYAITGGRLTTLAAPATLFTSLDDSIIDATDRARPLNCCRGTLTTRQTPTEILVC